MRALRLFALIALAACHDSTGPRPYGERIQLTARSVTATPGDTAHIRRVALESNTITVVGRISTPDPCTQLAAYAKTQGNTIAFTVVATESRGGCVTSLGLFEYTLTAAAPSCPHVTVTHHYVGSNWPDQQVLDVGWICAYAPAAAVRPPGA